MTSMSHMLVFDFDGTLADSLSAAHAIYNQLAVERDFRPISTAELPALRHHSLTSLLRTLGISPHHVPSLLHQGRKLLRNRLAEISPCSGLPEQLPILREKTGCLGILTSNSVENVEIFLQRHQLRHYFDFLSTCPRLKGKARFLRSITRTYSLPPRQLIYIGDEVRDLQAAQKAGTCSAAVTWGFNSEEALLAAHPDYLCRHPQDLLSLLRSSQLEEGTRFLPSSQSGVC